MQSFISTELDHIEERLNVLNKKLLALPEGKLSYSRTGKYIKYFQQTGKNKNYISKSDHSLVYELAYKQYLLAEQKDLQIKQQVLGKALTTLCKRARNVEMLLSKDSFSSLLRSEESLSNDELVHQWLNSPYPTNESFPDRKIHQSISGHFLRSKSEAFIDTVLFWAKLPFRYECELTIGTTTFYPDFTIMHPITHSIMIWEHFGMMNDPAYAASAYKKLQTYYYAGYIPSVNLICSFETAEKPMTIPQADDILHLYFKDCL